MLERYFLDDADREEVLRDVDDNWNVDIDLAIEVAARRHNCTPRQILQMLPLEKWVDFLIHSQLIPNIENWEFIDQNFNQDWLDGNTLE